MSLIRDEKSERMAAIEADVYAAGGYQIVGHDLGLHEDPDTAGRVLSNKVNENGRHRLSASELWQIKQWARERKGISRIHELECDALKFAGKWLSSDEIRAMRRQRKAELLRQLIELEQEEE